MRTFSKLTAIFFVIIGPWAAAAQPFQPFPSQPFPTPFQPQPFPPQPFPPFQPQQFSPPQVIGNSPVGPICAGPLGPGPCQAVIAWMQQNPQGRVQGAPALYQQQTFSAVGAAAQQIGQQCAVQSGGDLKAFAACAGQQIILPQQEQMMVDCAARSTDVSSFGICVGANALSANLNEAQQTAIQCIAETGGQPYAAAGCTASRLTAAELQKCITNGIGGPSGCFGDNNDLVGRNGWTVRTFSNVFHDIQNGPGPNNDLVGANGFVVRSANNIAHDIQHGPGANNDLVGCNGWANKHLFGGHC